MQISIFSYSDRGCQLALRIAALYRAQGHTATCHAIAKFAQKYQLQVVASSAQGVKDCFASSDMLVFVGACGIAVRALAPLLQSKTQDPACLVVDDGAQFVIPLVSGHIGGANEQACLLAAALEATPVVTTATDVNHRFSVDTFATKQGFAIESMAKAKEFSAQILTRDLLLITCPEIKVMTPLPSGLSWGQINEKTDCALNVENADVALIQIGVADAQEEAFVNQAKAIAAQPLPMTLSIGYRTSVAEQNSATMLRLTPKILTLGIGCKKNTPQHLIEALVQQVLTAEGIDPAAVHGVASIDLKANEAGLLGFCAAHGYPLQCYSAAQLQALEGSFTPSRFVQSVTGVDNVCERSALLAAQQALQAQAKQIITPSPTQKEIVLQVPQPEITQNAAQQAAHAQIICRKTSSNGVTLAIASHEMEVRFE